MTPNGEPPLKIKRNRVSTICSNCRARRLKCDRSKPHCGRCVSEDCTSTCTYGAGAAQTTNETFAYKDAIMNEMEITKLKNKIIELEDVVSYQRNILEMVKKTPNDSPISSKDSIVKEHKIDRQQQKFEGYAVLESNLVYLEPTSYFSTTMDDPDLSVMFSEIYKQMPPDVTFCRDAEDSKFLGNLPPIKDVDLLLDYFFNLCYPFVSFFNKDQIQSQVHHLLKDKGNYSTINAEKTSQSSLIAILLIMLRFTYIIASWDDSLLSGLSSNINITETYVDCAVGLLMAPQSFKMLKLEKIKGLMLLRIYKMYCPEDDDTTYSTSIINSSLVQSARALGLNQDVSKYPQKFLSSEEIQLWKDLWMNICYLDASYAFDIGMSPSTHLSEVIPPRSQEVARHGQEFNVNQLMMSSAKHLRVFLDGEIIQRVINHDELLNLSKNLGGTLLKLRSFQQLIVQSHSANDALSERAREFVFRLDLTCKEFTAYYLLHSSVNGAKKAEYLSKALERSLIILRMLHKSVVDKEMFFGTEIDKLMFPRMCIGSRMISFIILKLTKNVVYGEFSISQALKHFDSLDSTGIINWANIDFTDEQKSLVNILKRVYQIYSECSISSLRIYSSFKVCIYLKLILDHIASRYPQIMDFIENQIGWNNPVSLLQVHQAWQTKNLSNNFFNVENSFATLNNDLDKFLERLQDSDWMHHL